MFFTQTSFGNYQCSCGTLRTQTPGTWGNQPFEVILTGVTETGGRKSNITEVTKAGRNC